MNGSNIYIQRISENERLTHRLSEGQKNGPSYLSPKAFLCLCGVQYTLGGGVAGGAVVMVNWPTELNVV